jgi:hypothetical protein
LDDAKVTTIRRRLEMERQIAVIAPAANVCRETVVNPEIGHAGAAADGARVDVRRRAIE